MTLFSLNLPSSGFQLGCLRGVHSSCWRVYGHEDNGRLRPHRHHRTTRHMTLLLKVRDLISTLLPSKMQRHKSLNKTFAERQRHDWYDHGAMGAAAGADTPGDDTANTEASLTEAGTALSTALSNSDAYAALCLRCREEANSPAANPNSDLLDIWKANKHHCP